MEKILCVNCNTYVDLNNFCTNCGAKLAKKEKTDLSPNDKNLTLLIDCCSKTLATVGGDRHSEIVLYIDKKDGSYQIHTYEGDGHDAERHKGYHITRDAGERILQQVKEENLEAYLKNAVAPLCGREYILKVMKEDGEFLRLTDSNFIEADKNPYTIVFKLLADHIEKRNRILPEHVRNWKKVYICSSGMSQTSNYSYTLERQADGNLFLEANQKGVILSEQDREVIENMNIGGFDDAYMPGPNDIPRPMFMTGMMLDQGKRDLTVTYANGETAKKIFAQNEVNEIVNILKTYF